MESVTSSIVFVVARVSNYELLTECLEPGTEVVILDPMRDGVEQIAQALQGVSGLDSIHIISHGSQETVNLGDTTLTGGNIASYLGGLGVTGPALGESGDILPYGCDVGAGQTGQGFIDKLARQTVARDAAGHLPRLDLEASILSSRNGSQNSLNQDCRQNSIGLQLHVPLHAGGSVDSAVAQSLAKQSKAETKVEAEDRSVARDVQRFFLVANQAADRLIARESSLRAAQLTREGARRSLAAGAGTAADVLIAARRVADALCEAAKARFEDLLVRLRLQLRAGHDPIKVVEAIDAVFSAQAAARTPAKVSIP